MVCPVIFVHGGAGSIPDNLVEGYRIGCHRAATSGFNVLAKGGSAEDAVEAAIRVMEDDPVFDAGRGSFLNQDGHVELDAAFMEGAELEAGSVAVIKDIANPISLARLVMMSEHVFLAGEGAVRFALQHDMQRCDPAQLIVQRELEAWRAFRDEKATTPSSRVGDTVGTIALDTTGHLAAGNSTGGIQYKFPGRVGDVPCFGAGLYADDSLGAAISTGQGEAILRIVMAHRAVSHLAACHDPQEAAQEAIAFLAERVRGHAGILLVNPQGRMGCAFNTTRMVRAWSQQGRIFAAVEPAE